MASLVSIVQRESGMGIPYCQEIQSSNLRYRRMEMGDVGTLWDMFNRPDNREAYGSTKEKSLDAVVHLVERDIVRLNYTGYLIVSKICGTVFGRAAIGHGYSPLRDEIYEGSYSAALLDEDGGTGPSEVQIGDFLTTEGSIYEETGKSREKLYYELVISMIYVAASFIREGKLLNGQTVKRVTITLIEPETSGFSGSAQAELVMKKACFEGIFGAPIGILNPEDKRNYSHHKRNVYGCNSAELGELLERNLTA